MSSVSSVYRQTEADLSRSEISGQAPRCPSRSRHHSSRAVFARLGSSSSLWSRAVAEFAQGGGRLRMAEAGVEVEEKGVAPRKGEGGSETVDPGVAGEPIEIYSRKRRNVWFRKFRKEPGSIIKGGAEKKGGIFYFLARPPVQRLRGARPAILCIVSYVYLSRTPIFRASLLVLYRAS